MPDEIPNSTPEVQPETVLGDEVINMRCTGLLENRMQCIRRAIFKQPDDKLNKYALCEICKDLLTIKDKGLADTYSAIVERPKVL
jgi:hypothetical protein